MQILIFGAKSIALGACLAVQKLYQEFQVIGFLVSSKVDNPETLAGLPVYELKSFPHKNVCVLVATPEDTHEEIVRALEEQGFHNHICMDSDKESDLMERYYTEIKAFQSLHTL